MSSLSTQHLLTRGPITKATKPFKPLLYGLSTQRSTHTLHHPDLMNEHEVVVLVERGDANREGPTSVGPFETAGHHRG
ncbi:MAG: hypothetical protein DWC07_06575 [Candidatus Poseidoniales archaeon]|nr:MAG: hypothetical protein DWC07_06575 [Candidatus Poseidoniales archaeon]